MTFQEHHYASGEIQNCTEGSNLWNGWSWRPPQPENAAYERLGLAFGVMFTTEGIPLIYYGDEVGLAGGGDPDNRRLMPWNDEQLLPGQLALRTHLKRWRIFVPSIRRFLEAIGKPPLTAIHIARLAKTSVSRT